MIVFYWLHNFIITCVSLLPRCETRLIIECTRKHYFSCIYNPCRENFYSHTFYFVCKKDFNLDQIAHFFLNFSKVFSKSTHTFFQFSIVHFNLDRTNLCTICLILYLNNIYFLNVFISNHQFRHR